MKKCIFLFFFVMAMSMLNGSAVGKTGVLTLAQRLAQDKADMSFFTRSGDALKRDILLNHRGGSYGPHAELREAVNVSDAEFRGRNLYKFATRQAVRTGQTKKVLYIHGGAWVLESSPHQLAFAAWLADHSGAEIWFPEYPLAPEHSAAEAHEWLVALYQEMLRESPASEIAVMGDSAGGSIAAGLAMLLRDRGLPQPNNLILFSPGIDIMLYRTPEEIDYNSKLAAAGLNAVVSISQEDIQDWWRGDLPETDYRVNPIFGDLRGLAPLTVFAGSAENLAIIRFVAKAARQRVPLKYWEKLNAVHTWVVIEGQDNEEERELVLDVLRRPDDDKLPQVMEKVSAGRRLLGKIAPLFAELNDDVLFGKVWSRADELSPRDRSLVTVAGLMGMGMLDDSFRGHLQMAKMHGMSRDEIVEAITQLAFYTGWSKGWTALRMADAAFQE